MSATNSTTHYNLPSFIGSDKPAWLVDWNGAMSAIDAAIYEAKQTADTASASATSVASDLSTLASTVTSQGTSISTLIDSLTTLVGTVNTITSLIGNGMPTTTDKTIIGAINELHSDIQGFTASASDVSYNNATSGLTATNVQAAVDEVNAKVNNINLEATKILFLTDSYGNNVDSNNKKFWELVGESLNATVDAIVVGGARFHNDSFLPDIEAYAGSTDFDMIVITCGAGDIQASIVEADVLAGITNVVTALRTKFPKAANNILLMEVGTRFESTYSVGSRQTVPKFYMEGAQQNNIKYIPNCEYILRNSSLLTDNVHPTAAGVTVLAYYVTQGIKQGVVDVKHALATSAPNTDATPVTMNYYMERHNGIVKIHSLGGTGIFVMHRDSATYSGTAVEVATFGDTLVENTDGGNGYWISNVIATGIAPGGSSRAMLRGSAYVADKKLYLKLSPDDSSMTGAFTNTWVIGDLIFFD